VRFWTCCRAGESLAIALPATDALDEAVNRALTSPLCDAGLWRGGAFCIEVPGSFSCALRWLRACISWCGSGSLAARRKIELL
jgi:hypothetical protein